MSRESAAPRLLTIMGSGETSPTMVKVHRSLLDRLGPPPVASVLLDTPFGFQENSAEIAARAVSYFRESLQTKLEVAHLPRTEMAESIDPAVIAVGEASFPAGEEPDPFAEERFLSLVRDASYVFSGPGSPTYALSRWRGTLVSQLLLEKLRHGGAVTFASAAALTLGVATVPVYEIYKVGMRPHWLAGLDVLGAVGISAAVIPHFNNAEGGTHDTRFCYLGERRLARMEVALPAGAFVLGVDEHTALVLDLGSQKATVEGIGVVTVRKNACWRTFAAGETIDIAELGETALGLGEGAAAKPRTPRSAGARSAGGGEAGPPTETAVDPLETVVREAEEQFAAAVASRDVTAAVRAVLDLEEQVIDWSRDIPAGDGLDRARASLRAMIVELGKLAETGAQDPATVVGPYVEAVLTLRRNAREAGRYADADRAREILTRLGVEVRDTATTGTEWSLGGGES